MYIAFQKYGVSNNFSVFERTLLCSFRSHYMLIFSRNSSYLLSMLKKIVLLNIVWKLRFYFKSSKEQHLFEYNILQDYKGCYCSFQFN